MAQLHQVLAILKSIQSETASRVAGLQRASQRPELMTGLSRVYTPRVDGEYAYPGEAKKVQLTAGGLLTDLQPVLARLLDVTAAIDDANARARASVVIDETVILDDVPPTYLLFLEKQLTAIKAFIDKLPVLDPARHWEYDANRQHFVTRPVETAKTKKAPRVLTKAPATDKHPAQAEVFHEDVVEGTWSLTEFSGALPAQRKSELLERVTRLLHAVKFAREEANGTDARPLRPSDAIFSYLLAD